MRKVYVTLTVKAILLVDEGVELNELLPSMDITIADDRADHVDAEFVSAEVTDSK